MPSQIASGAVQDAVILASHGRHHVARTHAGDTLACFARSRVGTLVCGDRVRVRPTGAAEGVIEALLARSSLIYRADRKREKPIAANVTQAIVVLAPVPQPSLDLLDRCLAAAEHAGVKALLACNKVDLDAGGSLRELLAVRYGALGYRVCTLCARDGVDELRPALRGESSLLIGQSGVGKSTMVNALLPEARARTDAVSRSQAGRHTTTQARLYLLDEASSLIDSPGMHQFGLQHIAPEALAACFVEFRAFQGECRFNDCRHVDEPGCALVAAMQRGEVLPERVQAYLRILRSLRLPRSGGSRPEPARDGYEQDHEQP
jgi:ribosome biogenesis GTPase